jgi:hypothetical protein
VLTDNANRTFSGGGTNLVLLNGTNLFSGVNTFSAALRLPSATFDGTGTAMNTSGAGLQFYNADLFIQTTTAVDVFNIFSQYRDLRARSLYATNLYVTNLVIGGGAAITAYRSATATLNFGSILAAGYEDLTITVTGAAVNDTVTLGLPATVLAGAIFNAWVSAADTVTVRCNNAGAIAVDPASATYRVGVTSH